MVGSFKAGPDREVVGGLLAARLASPTHIPRITLIEIVQRIVKNQATQMSESSKNTLVLHFNFKNKIVGLRSMVARLYKQGMIGPQ